MGDNWDAYVDKLRDNLRVHPREKKDQPVAPSPPPEPAETVIVDDRGVPPKSTVVPRRKRK